MKDYKAISEKQAELIYQLSKQPNAIGKEWRERVEKLESEIAALEQQVEEQEAKRLTDAEIIAKSKLYVKDFFSNKDLSENDYCAGAVMAREFYTGVIQDLGEEQFKNK